MGTLTFLNVGTIFKRCWETTPLRCWNKFVQFINLSLPVWYFESKGSRGGSNKSHWVGVFTIFSRSGLGRKKGQSFG